MIPEFHSESCSIECESQWFIVAFEYLVMTKLKKNKIFNSLKRNPKHSTLFFCFLFLIETMNVHLVSQLLRFILFSALQWSWRVRFSRYNFFCRPKGAFFVLLIYRRLYAHSPLCAQNNNNITSAIHNSQTCQLNYW